MTVPASFAAPVQRAAAYVAARARGDRSASQVLLASFVDDAERALAFSVLAELAIGLLAAADDEAVDDVAARLALTLARPDVAGEG